MQLTQLLGMMGDDVPSVKLPTIKGIIQHSAIVNKNEIVGAIDQAMQPPSEEDQQKQKLIEDAQLQAQLDAAKEPGLQNQKIEAEIEKINAQAAAELVKAQHDDEKIAIEHGKLQLQAQEILQFGEQNKIARERLQIDRAKVNQSKSS